MTIGDFSEQQCLELGKLLAGLLSRKFDRLIVVNRFFTAISLDEIVVKRTEDSDLKILIEKIRLFDVQN